MYSSAPPAVSLYKILPFLTSIWSTSFMQELTSINNLSLLFLKNPELSPYFCISFCLSRHLRCGHKAAIRLCDWPRSTKLAGLQQSRITSPIFERYICRALKKRNSVATHRSGSREVEIILAEPKLPQPSVQKEEPSQCKGAVITKLGRCAGHDVVVHYL